MFRCLHTALRHTGPHNLLPPLCTDTVITARPTDSEGHAATERCPADSEGHPATERCPADSEGHTATERCPADSKGHTATKRGPAQSKEHTLTGCPAERHRRRSVNNRSHLLIQIENKSIFKLARDISSSWALFLHNLHHR